MFGWFDSTSKKLDCIERKVDHSHRMLHCILEAVRCCGGLSPDDKANLIAVTDDLKQQTAALKDAVDSNIP